jgi:phage-related protein
VFGVDLIQTVGARLVLLGQREYQTGMAGVQKSMADMGASTKTLTAASSELTDATIAAQAEQRNLAVATEAAVAAQREYMSALRASAVATAEDEAASTTATAAKRAEADARLAAAETARGAALTEVKASQTSAAAASTAAAEVEAAEARKVAAAEAGAKGMKTAFLGVVAVSALIAGAGVKMANDYQWSTNRLVTSAGESMDNLQMVREGMLQMAAQVGYSAEDLSAAMYKVESGGRHGAEGLDVLKAAAQGAKAEGADLTTVADALTSALQDYHLGGSDAADVTSKLVAATANGKMTFEELAGSMSAILPIASANKVSLDDVLGSMASMTVHGMSAQQASQNLADAIRHLSAPTQLQTKEMAALGISSQDVSEKLGERGVYGTIKTLTDAIQQRMGPEGTRVILNLNDALKKLSPEVQALGRKVLDGTLSYKDFTTQAKQLDPIAYSQVKSFATLAGSMHQIGNQQMTGAQAMQSYTDAMRRVMGDATGLNVALMITGENSAYTEGAINNISGATADAQGNVKGWEEIQQTLNEKLTEAGAGIGALAIQLGTYLLPILTVVVGWIADATRWMTEHKAVAMILAFAIGTVLVFALAALVVWLYSTAAGLFAIEVAGAPLILIVAAVIAAVALLAAAAYWIVTNWDPIVAWFLGVWQWIKDAASAAWSWVVNATRTAAGAVADFFRPAVDWLVGAWQWVVDKARAAWDFVVGIVQTAVNAILGFFRPAVNDISSHWDEVVQITRFVWGYITGFLQWVWSIISGIFTFGVNVVTTIVQGAWYLIRSVSEPIWTGIKDFFVIIWSIISGIFNIAATVVVSVLDLAWTFIKNTVLVVWAGIVGVLQAAWALIVGIFTTARDIVVGIFVVLLDILSGNWARAWTDIKDFGARIWHDITDTLMGIATGLWHGLVGIWDALVTGTEQMFSSLWDGIKNTFLAGVNGVIDLVNGFLGLLNDVAGAVGFSLTLHINHVGGLEEGGVIPVQQFARGGQMPASEVGPGFMTNGARAIVGEGNPMYPEFVIPTDPRFRNRALGLFGALAGHLGGGVPGYEDGGILGDVWGGIVDGADWVWGGITGAIDWVGKIAADGIRSVIESVWPELPAPENSLAALVPDTINSWRKSALDWFGNKSDPPPAPTWGAPAGPPGPVADVVRATAAQFGWDQGAEWDALSWVISHESGWNPNAQNPTSTAYGLFQFLDGTWASVGIRKTADAAIQALGGMRYIASRYRDPIGAQQFWAAHHWYESGGTLPAAGSVTHLPARAGGGPVAPGMPYLVGERGPEVFVPDTAGGIVPNGAMGSTSFGLGATVVVQPGAVVIHQAKDPAATYEAVKRGIADAIARR